MGWLLMLMSAVTLPIMLLNIFGVVVGGVWLGILGEWGKVGIGIAGMVGGAFLCSILMLPGFALTIPGLALWVKGGVFARLLATPLLLIGHSWTYVVMTAWAFGAFLLLFKNVSVYGSILPYALWAYGVATAPWTYMLQKDVQAGNDHGAIGVFFLQIACVLLVLGSWLQIWWLSAAFWLVMALSLVVGVLNAGRLLFSEARR